MTQAAAFTGDSGLDLAFESPLLAQPTPTKLQVICD